MKLEKIKLYFFGALLVIGLPATFLFFDNSVLDSIYLKIDFAYTISEPITIDTVSINLGLDYIYIFTVEDKVYAGFTKIPPQDGIPYFVKFYPKNPERNKLTTVIADSEDIRNLPPGGYKELPHKEQDRNK